jgi:ATP-dependent Clp protease protease subunit
VKKFWHWAKNETGEERTLYINGVIAEESWLGDEVTPKIFEEELLAGAGGYYRLDSLPGRGNICRRAHLQPAHGVYGQGYRKD